MARLGVDATHSANHFAGEQNVIHRDHLGQQVNARLVVHAGVKEDVVQQMLLQQRLLQLLGQAPVPCGIKNFSVGKSLNRSEVRHCMKAVVSAFR